MMRTQFCMMVLAALAWSAELDFSVDEISNADVIPAALARAADNAYGLNMKGLDALEAGDLAAARGFFLDALEKLPGYSDAQNNLAVVYFRKGDVAQAEHIWQTLTQRDPQYALAFHNLGIAAFHAKRYAEAAGLFERAIKGNPKLTEAYVLRGKTALLLGRSKEALEYFSRAYKINPNHPDAWSYLAYGYIRNGDTAKALPILQANEKSPVALSMLGGIEAGRKNLAKASEYYIAAVNKGAEPDLLARLAAVQIEAGFCRQAIASMNLYFSQETGPGADAYLTSGIALMECGDSRASIERFERGIEKYPGDPLLRYNLGKLYFIDGRYDAAEAAWKPLSDTAHDPELMFMRAEIARKKNDLAGAEKRIRAALGLDQKAQYYDMLGLILFARGKKDESESQFKEALRVDPSLRSAQIHLSLAGAGQEGGDAAIRALEKDRAACTRKCSDITARLAVLYYQKQRFDDGISVLQSLPADDQNEQVLRTLAFLYRESHRWDDAAKVLESMRGRSPGDAQAGFELADAYLSAGHYAKAIEVLTACAAIKNVDATRLHYLLGYAYASQNDYDKGAHEFEKCLQLDPSHFAAQGMLAYAYAQSGDQEKARILWEKNLKSDPSNPVLLINLGLAAEAAGNFQEALGYYKKATAIKPDNADVQIDIGNAYAGLDKPMEAAAAYEKALGSPKRELAAYNLFLLAQKQGDRVRQQSMADLLRREFPRSLLMKRADADMAAAGGDTARALGLLVALEKKDGDDSLQIARWSAQLGNSGQAVQYLAGIGGQDKRYREKQDILAQSAFNAKNYKEAYTLWSGILDTAFALQYNCALAAFEAGEYDAAERLGLRMEKSAGPNDRTAVWRLLGNTAVRKKDWNGARDWFSRITEAEPRNAVALFNLAAAWYNLNDIRKSYDCYQKARAIDPSLVNRDIENRHAASQQPAATLDTVIDPLDEMYNKAVALQGKGKNGEAERIYRTIVEKNPSHAPSWNNLGALYAAKGKLDKAVEAYSTAVEKQPDMPEAFANLANICLATGEYDKAKEWVTKGLTSNPGNGLLVKMGKQVDEAAAKNH